MIVVAIAANVVVQLCDSYEGNLAKLRACKRDFVDLKQALNSFAADTGRYPTTLEGFQALIDAPAGIDSWRGPYLNRLPKDPWGNPYIYRGVVRNSVATFELCTTAGGGKERSADDITNDAPDS
jgi:general secretion pathway protein G